MAEQQETQEANVVKGGEQKIQLIFRRGAAGLSLSVKTTPDVEEFFRGVGNGNELVPVAAGGRHWFPMGGVESLSAYALGQNIEPVRLNNGQMASFGNLGRPLISDGDEDRYPIGGGLLAGTRSNINLSFLRLAGISEGTGVQFGIKGVYTTDNVTQLRDLITDACRKFYKTYLTPIGLVVSISTQELR